MMDIHEQMALLERVSRTFALTIPQLPPPLADCVGNAYLLCRIADTIEDEPRLDCRQKAWQMEQFLAALAGALPGEQFAQGLSPLLSQATPPAEQELIARTPGVLARFFAYPEPVRQSLARCVAIMSRGMAHYQEQACAQGLADQAALDDYCYYVAGVVGEMLTELFLWYCPSLGAQRERLLALAVSFGQGLQMTNILKDVQVDGQRGISWLPRTLCRRHGLDPALAGRQSPAFAAVVAELAAIARGHLQDALEYTLLLPAREQGMRQFCLWAIGMGLLTLGLLERQAVQGDGGLKISRRAVKRVIIGCRLTGWSSVLTRAWFAWLGQGGRRIGRSPVQLRRAVSRWDPPLGVK